MDLPDEYLEAMAHIEKGNRGRARDLLQQLSIKYPDNGFFYLEYAINCIYLECADIEIEAAFNKAEPTVNESPRYYFYRGLFMEGKDKEEALRLYNKAISMRPGYLDALVRACTIYAEKGDFKSAIVYYDMIPLEQRSSSLILRMIDLFTANEDYKRAKEGLNELIRRQPRNELYLERLRDFYEKKGDIKKRDEVLLKIKGLSPVKKRSMRPLK